MSASENLDRHATKGERRDCELQHRFTLHAHAENSPVVILSALAHSLLTIDRCSSGGSRQHVRCVERTLRSAWLALRQLCTLVSCSLLCCLVRHLLGNSVLLCKHLLWCDALEEREHGE